MGANFSKTDKVPRTQVFYRCVCGKELLVDLKNTMVCDDCNRKIMPEAIQLAMTATLSISDPHSPHLLTAVRDLPEVDPLCNQVLGHFRLDSRLGAGGMGAVYRALDTSLQRYVAVKVLRGFCGSGASPSAPEKVTSLLQEAVAQARLNHPHVVTIFYVGRHEGEPFLAMELVDGETLSDTLKRGPLPYTRVIGVAIQVADALRHANQFGIVHGDIKPSNLLVVSETHVKLSDFGLSRLSTRETDREKLAGTPAYLAPELLYGSPSNMQSDMYALGITFYELTFGKRPFAVSNSEPVEENQDELPTLEFPAVWPRDVPREWANVLRRLLAAEPSERYATYDDLIDDISRLVPISSTQAAPAPRAMAYLLDQSILLLLMGPFAIALAAINQAPTSYRFLEPILALFSLVVPGTHLILARRGFRTLGRYLFQLRVVDEHGLPLPPRSRMTREFLRCMIAWLAPFATYAGLYSAMVDVTIDGMIVTYLAADSICVFTRKDGRSLHDLLSRSRIVLEQPS